MRIVVLLLLFACAAQNAACQEAAYAPPAAEETDGIQQDSAYTLLYYKGEAQYKKGNYCRAEGYFRKAFELQPGEETARYLYYALLYQGYDLEAANLVRQYPAFTFAIPPQRKGLESAYTDFGPRISANASAGNILYADAGAFCRVSRSMKLWQSLTFLKQDEDLGHYRQYEYFASLTAHLGGGWYLSPAFHYDYVPYTFTLQQTNNVSYTAAYETGPHDTTIYRTSAVQTVNTTIPGTAHFFNLSLPVSRRAGAFFFEAEPSLHFFPDKGTVQVSYHSIGTTEAFERDRRIGSMPFSESGSSSRDTSYRDVTVQAGLAAGYRLPIPREPLTLRAAAWYLADGEGTSAVAYHLSATFWWRKIFRLYGSWMCKGSLPLSLHTEGQYFNFNDPVKSRAGLTFQLFPLQHFSPMITYQYEHDERLRDAAQLMYHAVYLTLKYSL